MNLEMERRQRIDQGKEGKKQFNFYMINGPLSTPCLAQIARNEFVFILKIASNFLPQLANQIIPPTLHCLNRQIGHPSSPPQSVNIFLFPPSANPQNFHAKTILHTLSILDQNLPQNLFVLQSNDILIMGDSSATSTDQSNADLPSSVEGGGNGGEGGQRPFWRDQEEIVISGVSGRFPRSENVQEFGDLLLAGEDLITEDDLRWPPGAKNWLNSNWSNSPIGLYDLPKRHGKLKELRKFDAQFFSVTPKQANYMDPQVRILLEVAYEAMIDAGGGKWADE
jgi:hypothetical protein